MGEEENFEDARGVVRVAGLGGGYLDYCMESDVGSAVLEEVGRLGGWWNGLSGRSRGGGVAEHWYVRQVSDYSSIRLKDQITQVIMLTYLGKGWMGMVEIGVSRKAHCREVDCAQMLMLYWGVLVETSCFHLLRGSILSIMSCEGLWRMVILPCTVLDVFSLHVSLRS